MQDIFAYPSCGSRAQQLWWRYNRSCLGTWRYPDVSYLTDSGPHGVLSLSSYKPKVTRGRQNKTMIKECRRFRSRPDYHKAFVTIYCEACSTYAGLERDPPQYAHHAYCRLYSVFQYVVMTRPVYKIRTYKQFRYFLRPWVRSYIWDLFLRKDATKK